MRNQPDAPRLLLWLRPNGKRSSLGLEEGLKAEWVDFHVFGIRGTRSLFPPTKFSSGPELEGKVDVN